MQSRPRIFRLLLRVFVRLGLGLMLLVGLCLTVGELARPAHAATTITVSTCDESHLDAAISQANSENANDTITFSCSGDIKLTSTLTISGSMTLDGSGQNVTLDGQGQVRVLSVSSGVTLTLKGLTISNGIGVFFPDYRSTVGGGIFNSGTVSISNSTLSNNSASGSGASGGGLFDNQGTVSISNSTFSGNSASTYGGGIDTFRGTVSISNSTFANNSASRGIGGGLDTNGGTVSISNSTFANNSDTPGGGGGALSNAGTINIGGSIVANNTGGNCYGYTLSDQGYNLESGTDCGFTGTGDLQNTNPELSALADNGGPTQTMALQPGSPAIDRIPAASCPAKDQRGNARPDDAESACDIGAYESYPPDADLSLSGLPNNITVDATSTQGAVVTYTSPTAVDEDSPLPTVTCDHASGSTFAIGTTSVTCTATDSDDTNSPVSQSFTVTVADTDLGLSNMPSNITVNATGPTGASVTYTSPTAVDEDSPLPTVTCDHASGSTFAIGTTSVTCTVSDSDDTPNSVSKTFTVTVKDVTPPVLSLPSPIPVDATSPQGASVTYMVTATDPDNAASELTISCSPASGSTFAIGTTMVKCSASDPAGNKATGSFQVVVKGAAAQVNDLVSLVNSFHLSSSLQNALDVKLNAAFKAINAGQTATACSDLSDFIGQVYAQTGKGITTSQATQLIAAATNIKKVLAC